MIVSAVLNKKVLNKRASSLKFRLNIQKKKKAENSIAFILKGF